MLSKEISQTKNLWLPYSGECLEKLDGHIDILLNGAGIQYRCPAVDFPHDRWQKILDINLSAVFYLSQLAGRTMLEQHYGRIINIASMTSFFGSVLVPAYAASKAGVAQITKALSNEWAGNGITVNAIAPGYMATELTRNMKEVNPDSIRKSPEGFPREDGESPRISRGSSFFWLPMPQPTCPGP